MEVEKKSSRDEIYANARRERLLKDHSELVVNGVRTTVSEYTKNPKKFDKAPLDPAYVKTVEESMAKSIATKSKLAIDPSTLKSLQW